MKVDIITRHSVPNYGSLLQSYATQQTIKKLGFESEIINYTRYEERYKNLVNSLIKGKKWDKNIILRTLYKCIQMPNYAKQYSKFKEFRKELLVETDIEYGCIDELKDNPPVADVYCSGSDQIWGKIGTADFDEAYFLEFVQKGKCISYASSFGKEKLDENLDNNILRLLKKYTSILVRENTAKKIIMEKGLKNVEQVLDPTFLLSKDEWEKLAYKSDLKLDKDFILIYQLHDNKEFNDYAKRIAKIKKKKLIRLSPSIFHVIRSGKMVYLPTPYDFIKLFLNADYILTDSFHATAFSIIFNKKFIDVLPLNKTGTRIESILELCELRERLLKNYSDYKVADNFIDYSLVNNIIENERSKSIELLAKSINGR